MQSNLRLPEKGKGKECTSGVACKPPGVRPPSAYMVFPFLGRLLFFGVSFGFLNPPLVGSYSMTAMGLLHGGLGLGIGIGIDIGGDWKRKMGEGSSCTCIPTGILKGVIFAFCTHWLA